MNEESVECVFECPDKLGMANIEHRGYLWLVGLCTPRCLWERDRPRCGKHPSFDTAEDQQSALSVRQSSAQFRPSTQKEGFV